MIISPLDLNQVVTAPDMPNHLPKNHKRSKAWRTHYLGKCVESNIRQNIFLIFVIDDVYGFCPYEIVYGHNLSVRRKGKTYLNFQCDYPKDRVFIVAFHNVARPFDKSAARVMQSVHENFLRRMSMPEENTWQAFPGPAASTIIDRELVDSFTDYVKQCDDSFEKENSSGT